MATAARSQVNLAVVGAEGVGKSTFVQFALDLQHPPMSRSSIKKISLDGTIYLVRLLEIAIHNVTFDEEGRIVWPTVLGEHILPPIDGILCLFDANDLTTVTNFSHIFGKLPLYLFSTFSIKLDFLGGSPPIQNPRTEGVERFPRQGQALAFTDNDYATDGLSECSNIPFVIVACNNSETLQSPGHEAAVFEEASRILAEAKILKATANDPESHKKCISTLIESLIFPKRTSSMAYSARKSWRKLIGSFPHPHKSQQAWRTGSKQRVHFPCPRCIHISFCSALHFNI